MRFEGIITTTWRTQLQRAIADGNGLCGVTVAGVGTRFRLVFIVAQMVGHFGVESRLNADFLQQAIELAEIVRDFEIFGQFIRQNLQFFLSIN